MLKTLKSVLGFQRSSWNPAERRLARVACVDDLRMIAKRRLPGGVFDYIDGAAEDERTASRNSGAFGDYGFRPRVLRDVSGIDTRRTILGRELSFPLLLSPTGFTRMAHREGEVAVARCAARSGLPYVLSTLSTKSIEQVAEAGREGARAGGGADARLWFQVYVWKDRELVKDLLSRARESGYEAIVITVDAAVLGRRERDVRHGFEIPPKLGLDTILDGAFHPAWTWDFLRGDPIEFSNVVGRHEYDGRSAINLAELFERQFDAKLSWQDIDWFRSAWDGPVVLKGVQSVEDARLAEKAGVDAIALSNHGGRQLDGAPSPLDLLAPVRDAIGDAMEVYCDGGIRRGSDLVKALALGATAGMIGRAYLYGLGAAGERGVSWVLDHLESETRRVLALLGRPSIADLDRDCLESTAGHPRRLG